MMNKELIDDLAMQAGVNMWNMTQVGFVSFEEHELEKFAELIILECTKIIDPTHSLCSISEESVRYNCMIEMFDHFGMK